MQAPLMCMRKLPDQLEKLRDRRIWLCYPLIYNPAKHGGVGGYDKPPINPYTLRPGKSNDPNGLATFDEAFAQIHKTAHAIVKGREKPVECKVAGVGIAFGGTGLVGLDLDNVASTTWLSGGQNRMTDDALRIMELLDTYTEVSPSGTGLHMIFNGSLSLPEGAKTLVGGKPDIFGGQKGEYMFMTKGYMALSGRSVNYHDQGAKGLAERSEQAKLVYERFFETVKPIEKLSGRRPAPPSSPVVSCNTGGYTYERWMQEVSSLRDETKILERIFMSGSTGRKVEELYNCDMSDKGNSYNIVSMEYGGDHSRADQALCTYLYGFTNDRGLTETFFRNSKLYRATGKGRDYIDRTLDFAEKNCKQLVGHIEFTADEKRAYARQKQNQEIKELNDSFNKFMKSMTRKRGI